MLRIYVNIFAAMAIVDATITAIIPTVILPQFGMFCDMRTQGYGDVTHFRVMPGSFYTVSRESGERAVARQRKFAKDILVTPIEHAVTVYENMGRVLAGKANIADFMAWVLTSVEKEMYKDALSALNTGLANTGARVLAASGTYDVKTLIELCEKVQALNGGVKPIICGSASALLNVVPDATTGWRINADGNNPAVELVRSMVGYDVLKLDNAIDGANLVLGNNKLYIISPSMDKLVKGVLNSAMSNGSDFYQNADLTKNFTYRKGWDFIFASAAACATYTITG